MLLQPSVERDDAEIEDLSLATMIDEDPLIYFLTPTPSTYAADEEGMDFDMDFDAGIEDAKHPPPIIRSVSPSSLGGLSRPPPPRPPTPPRSPATPDLDYDLSVTPDEHEQYDYMENSWPPKRGASSSSVSLPRRLKDKFKGHGGSSSADNLAVPYTSSPRPSSSRGRATSRAGPKPIAAAGASGNTRRSTTTTASSSARLSPHAWREPSPDVWAIEEEPEEEGELLGSGSGMGDSDGFMGEVGRAVDIPAAKPKKKVRFVLPATYGGL
jgi:hypothetical protein